MLTCALIILGAFGLAALALAFVAWRYPVEPRGQRLTAKTADGWELAVWFRAAKAPAQAVPVVLCHGLANNHAFMDFRGAQNLARFLSDRGFNVYSVDLRGAGASAPPHEGPWEVSVDDHLRYDVPALVALVRAHAGCEQVLWVGHSLGGIIGLAAAPELGGALAGLVTVGSPFFFRVGRTARVLLRIGLWCSPWGRFDASLARLIAPLAGRVQLRGAFSSNLANIDGVAQRHLLAQVFAPIWRGVMVQLLDWVEHDACRSLDGVKDYRAGLAAVRCPVLVVGGTVDLLCPPPASEELFAQLGSTQKSLRLFEAYGHGDLITGRRAHEEVYPVIEQLLRDAV